MGVSGGVSEEDANRRGRIGGGQAADGVRAELTRLHISERIC